MDLNTLLVSAALVASSLNSLLTTITLTYQVNERTKILNAMYGLLGRRRNGRHYSGKAYAAGRKPRLRR